MASADLRKELECSICLTVYTDPVMLTCGHNFCRVCIDGVLDTQGGSGGYSCPGCREEFPDRPALHRNITLRNIVENILSNQPGQEDSGVFCTYCVESPVPAVKSCLHCEVSLCDKHLSVHSKSEAHVLTDPGMSVETCFILKEKILEYYCIQDSALICLSCSQIGEHNEHEVEPVELAFGKRKRKLIINLWKLMLKQEKTEEQLQSLQRHGEKVQEEAEDEAKRVAVLFRDLRRRLEELEESVLGEISGRAEKVLLSVNDLIRQLEIKTEERARKMVDIEELCTTANPFQVIQESDRSDLAYLEDGDNEEQDIRDKLHNGGDLGVAGILHTLYRGLSDIMKEVICILVTKAELLKTSKQVSGLCPGDEQSDILIRPSLLGSQCWGFTEGQRWVTQYSQGRESRIGYNHKSWGLWKFNDQYLAVYNSHEILLPSNVCCNRIMIYLDYEAGRISFYDLLDPIRPLHTITTTFTEPLHAVFGGWEGCTVIVLES